MKWVGVEMVGSPINPITTFLDPNRKIIIKISRCKNQNTHFTLT